MVLHFILIQMGLHCRGYTISPY